MRIGDRRCLLCDCEGTMPLDPAGLARALGTTEPALHHQLCRRQLDAVRAAAGEPVLVACTQEAPILGEAAPDARFVNIRERAGWSDEAARATPKIAALLAEAAVAAPAPATVIMRSEGRCLVLGRDETALEAAQRLHGRLTVTLLLEVAGDLLPPGRLDFPILFGRVAAASGHLGAFAVEVAGLAPASVSARERLRPAAGAETGRLDADLLVDLRDARPLFPAHERRDGYLRARPSDPVGVERALFEASGLVGEFEKPRYVTFDAGLCAHSRSRRTGCTRCLEQCPTGAIVPAGDHVAIDAQVCAGCGACAGVCPTGAATYADPPPETLLARLRALLGTYHRAGGQGGVLLLHEARHGGGLIDVIARRGRGLPARVLPVALESIAQFGFEHLAGAAAFGAGKILVLAPGSKAGEIAGLSSTLGYVRAVLDGLGHDGSRLELLIEDDPDALEGRLWELPPRATATAGDFVPLGGKRALMRAALDQLHRTAPDPVDRVALPEGAPFGALRIDAAGCTLCLACVGACPTGALLDNPERPMLRFVEDACVQCGLCRSTCPEKVIALEPRIDFTPEARTPRIVKEEEPAQCPRCGKAFGTRSSIEQIVARLAGRNPLFETPEQVALIRMCDDCRVKAQFERTDNPMTHDQPRRPRSSEDYLCERETKRKE